MAKLVNWHTFERKIKEKRILLFSAIDICRLFGATKTTVNLLLHRYEKKGFIVRVKRGLYLLPDASPPDLFIANMLCEPSYVSLECALSYHRVIPETVYEITSVTPNSTRRFETLGKIFSYRSIKKSAFTGYKTEQEKGFGFHVADPEKAFVDANYFRLWDGGNPISRFDREKIDLKKALHYARLFNTAQLEEIIQSALQ